ncbi:MAG: DUF4365 domain-containing protein [Acholeplasma sp.]|nr:DUF4365 domain-containing protein [Acholeplasma sp.]
MANSTERQGIGHCLKVAAINKWMFREQPIDDIGIDAHMEMVDNSGKPKQMLAVQIKSGASWFGEQKDNDIIFRDIVERQFNYWTTNSLPCILVLYNPDNDLCIWQKLTRETIERTKNGEGKGFFVRVPLDQVFLDYKSNNKLLSFTNLPEHITNYNFLLSQKRFMQIIQDGGEIKLHSTEWINKSSGRGETDLIVDDGITIKTYPYPYWFPYTPYTEVFPKLFPWADISADDGFFENEDEANWREYHCHYDKEDDEWLIVGDTFEDYRRKLSPMRSIVHVGEVAEYMMVLNLNDLGKSFLIVDDFVSKRRPYVDVRPSEE